MQNTLSKILRLFCFRYYFPTYENDALLYLLEDTNPDDDVGKDEQVSSQL